MAWSIPMTAVAGSTFTAAQFNQYVRDNLNETAPAKASAANQWIVSAGSNAVVARTISSVLLSTSESTTSNTFTDLTTPGPAVTATTGTMALVPVSFSIANSSTGFGLVAVAVTGSTTIAASDTNSVGLYPGSGARVAGLIVLTGLTAGSNTFTLKYRQATGTTTFLDRRIGVLPL